MNRIKKELRRKGIKLEVDYPTIPYYIKGKSCFERGYILLDGIYVNSEEATVKRYLNIGIETIRLTRTGKLDYSFD